MEYFSPEILNIIFSYVPSPPTNILMKYIIEDCYKEDYDPYTSEYYHDNYCFEYTFKEWYFLYRKNHILKRKKNAKYKHTPYPTYVGSNKSFYLL